MELEKKLSGLLIQAQKARDSKRVMALRALKSAVLTERTRHSGPMSLDAELQVIASYRKKMSNVLDTYRDAGRTEMLEQAQLEIAVCDELLPAQLTEDEIESLVISRIKEIGASSPAEMGKVMGPLMKELKGKADGNLVRQLVQKNLGG
ncbi:GatB/YqeY domain-containing protein [bacterium]|nr:GatB/YqeY domain-containing protein [bacterium]